jgi:hypothetical protein
VGGIMIFYIASGLLGVSNMILWGVYGDLLVERFSIFKIFRSLVLGISWSILLFFVNSDLPLFIVALSVITLERITTEIYKALIRVEDQAKYKIPSDLNIKWNRTLRAFLGVSLIIILALSVYFGELPLNKIYITIIIGVFAALSGALKDAPYEGFNLITFFRSPAIAIVLGILLSILFPAITGKFLLLAIAGGERIVSEFYKKIFRGRIPGKFKQIEFNENWKEKRKWPLIIYWVDIIGIVLLIRT